MSEGSDLSPESQAPSSGSGFTTGLAWIVIVASVAFLAWTANHPPEEAGAEDGKGNSVPAEAATELAMLKMQSQIIIGLSQLHPVEAVRSLEDLKDMAKTARGKAAVAIVHTFVDQKNGLEKGIKFLEQIDTADETNLEFKTKIQKALNDGVSVEERAGFKNTLSWFARLIPASENSPEAGIAAQVRAEGLKSLVIYGGFIACFLLAGLTGLVLLILFFTYRSSGRLKLQFSAADGASCKHLFVEAFAIYIGIMALGQLLGSMIHEGISMVCYGVSFFAAVFWPKIRGCRWAEARNLMGLSSGKGVFREVGAGILGYLGILIFAVGGLILTLLLIKTVNMVQGGTTAANGTDAAHPIVGMMDASKSILGKLTLLFLAAGLAPFLEETMFRGSLYRYLRHKWGFLFSSIIGGIIFAVIHPQGIFALPALAAMGMGFALLREWRDSLIASMTAHALNNGFIVGFLFLVMG